MPVAERKQEVSSVSEKTPRLRRRSRVSSTWEAYDEADNVIAASKDIMRLRGLVLRKGHDPNRVAYQKVETSPKATVLIGGAGLFL